MCFWRIALAVGGLLFLPLAAAEVGLVPPAVMPLPVAGQTSECWLGHAQVQPSTSREGVAAGEAGGESRPYVMVDRHAGAEHPTAAKMRPCNSLPPPGHPAGDEPTLRP